MLYGYQGEALVGQGILDAGIEAFRRGMAIAAETGTVHGLWSLLAKLATAEEAAGHPEEAAQLFQEARATLEQIIEYIPEENGPPLGGVRASFLALPTVKSVLA